MRKKSQKRCLQLLLNDAINEKKSTTHKLTALANDFKDQLRSRTTWMKQKLICFSVNRTLEYEKKNILKRHHKKLQALISLKRTAEGIEENPNETITNLTGEQLTPDQIEVLKLGLRYGLATRPNHYEIMSVAEDIWDQVSRLDNFKDGRYVKDRVKNSLRSFTYNYIDLDLKEFKLSRTQIKILNELTVNYSILKPDKGNGVVIMKRCDYISSVKSLFTNSTKFKKITSDPTPSRLASLQAYLSTLLKRDEITKQEYSFMRPQSGHFARAHGLPKTHKTFNTLPAFRPIVDTTSTTHYNVGKFLSSLLNPLTTNEFSISDSFEAVSSIQSISQQLFLDGYKFVSFDVESLFTNVPLKRTVNIILDRVFKEKLIDTKLRKRTLKKLIFDCCNKTSFSFDNQLYEQTDGVSMGLSLGPVLANIILTEFEKCVVSDLIQSGTIKFYRRYVDDTLVLIKPTDIQMVLDKFNQFDKNLNFTVDTFPDGFVHFLDVKIDTHGTDVYRKNTHTGQYTHFSSFEPFARKTAWIKSLFHRAFKICSNKQLFDKQVETIKSFMSWNGYPKGVVTFLINKLHRKYFKNNCNHNTQSNDKFDNLPKVWIRIPYLGTKGEFLLRSCISKIQRSLKNPVKFVVIYNTKTVSFFTSNKDKIPDLAKNNVVYQITCPGCNKTYIGKTQRCLGKRLSEHASKPKTSAVAQHFFECENAQFISSLNNMYERLNDPHYRTNTTSSIKSLILNNTKILFSNRTTNNNQLLLLEALHIKFLQPELNSGLKASKDLSLFS